MAKRKKKRKQAGTAQSTPVPVPVPDCVPDDPVPDDPPAGPAPAEVSRHGGLYFVAAVLALIVLAILAQVLLGM